MKKSTKVCPACKIDKPRTSKFWHICASKGISAYCRDCHPIQSAAQRNKDPRISLLKSIQKSARVKGLDINVCKEDIIIPQFCPVLKIPLIKTSGKVSYNSPSVDRIDSSKGYIKGNIQIISMRANALKSNATVQELEAVLAFIKNGGRASS